MTAEQAEILSQLLDPAYDLFDDLALRDPLLFFEVYAHYVRETPVLRNLFVAKCPPEVWAAAFADGRLSWTDIWTGWVTMAEPPPDRMAAFLMLMPFWWRQATLDAIAQVDAVLADQLPQWMYGGFDRLLAEKWPDFQGFPLAEAQVARYLMTEIDREASTLTTLRWFVTGYETWHRDAYDRVLASSHFQVVDAGITAAPMVTSTAQLMQLSKMVTVIGFSKRLAGSHDARCTQVADRLAATVAKMKRVEDVLNMAAHFPFYMVKRVAGYPQIPAPFAKALRELVEIDRPVALEYPLGGQ